MILTKTALRKPTSQNTAMTANESIIFKHQTHTTQAQGPAQPMPNSQPNTTTQTNPPGINKQTHPESKRHTQSQIERTNEARLSTNAHRPSPLRHRPPLTPDNLQLPIQNLLQLHLLLPNTSAPLRSRQKYDHLRYRFEGGAALTNSAIGRDSHLGNEVEVGLITIETLVKIQLDNKTRVAEGSGERRESRHTIHHTYPLASKTTSSATRVAL